MKNIFLSLNATSIIDYFFVIALIFLSGNQIFGDISLIIVFFLVLILFISRKKQFDIKFIFLILFFLTILLLQTFIFDFYSWRTIVGACIRIVVVYFILISIGKSFIDKFIKVMYYIAIISLIVFSLIVILPGFVDFLINNFTIMNIIRDDYSIQRFYLGFYTVPISPMYGVLLRNTGPFWEAGALGGYVIIALIFNIISKKKIVNKINIIYLLTIITTFSTTSIISLFLLFFFYAVFVKKSISINFLLLPILILIGAFLFIKVDFLAAKIITNFKLMNNPVNLLYGPSSRFLDAVRDLDDFRGHEMLGRGGHSQTRFLKKYKDNNRMSRTEGMTDFLVRYGIMFFILTIFFIYYSQVSLIEMYGYVDKSFAVGTTIVLFVLLQSELYFNYPLFWGLLFLYRYRKNK